MELKSCSREQTDVSDAYLQIRNYMQIIPQVFYYNAFCIISDMLTTRAGTITADETRFMAWKTIDGSEYLDNPDFSILIKGMLEKNRLLDIIRNFIVFQKEEKGDILSYLVSLRSLTNWKTKSRESWGLSGMRYRLQDVCSVITDGSHFSPAGRKTG